jgi:hypothetical protein
MIQSVAIPVPPEPMTKLTTFLWAAGGSFSLEIISIYNGIKAERISGLPPYYKTVGFWVVRTLVAAIAGALAIAESANNPLIAINIGASAPAILLLFERQDSKKPR